MKNKLRIAPSNGGECRLQDHGGLSADVMAVEAGSRPQALWVAVRPAWHGDVQDKAPSVWICLQDVYMGSGLNGPVMLAPEVWRQLAAAVEWRLRQREPWWRRILHLLT